jgi:hypothetical protein
MNNSVVQENGRTYLHIDDWYIGVHLDRNGDLMLFIDHQDGKVVDYNEVIAEDEFQWGKAFYVSRTRLQVDHLPQRKTLRNKIRVEVIQ